MYQVTGRTFYTDGTSEEIQVMPAKRSTGYREFQVSPKRKEIIVDAEYTPVENDCTDYAIKLFRKKKISAEFAANNIVSDIRHYLICNINDKRDSCSISDIQYLDDVLFNDLKVLICILLTECNNEDVVELIKKRIETVCYDVDYILDEKYVEKIDSIIKRICK